MPNHGLKILHGKSYEAHCSAISEQGYFQLDIPDFRNYSLAS